MIVGPGRTIALVENRHMEFHYGFFGFCVVRFET